MDSWVLKVIFKYTLTMMFMKDSKLILEGFFQIDHGGKNYNVYIIVVYDK